ncbi:MAG: signal peptidase I [Acidobacteriota bacterium]|jgi:signal peptidase I
MNSRLRQFLFPKITARYLLRVAVVSVVAYLFFAYVCTPFMVRGQSMESTYRNGEFDFLWKPAFLFSGPRRGDVVALRLAGEHVVFLKRVVALSGDEVAFRHGVLYRNGLAVDEPYVKGPCRWNLPPRRVLPGNVYVVGDNRSMPMAEHDFGQTSESRIVGTPLW